MIDLHTHSIFSDGELIPAELARRAAAAGYRAIAITDHGDASNIDFIIPRMVQACGKLSRGFSIDVIPGIELTHIPPEYIHELAVESRRLGAKIIVVHGETIVEPVAPGTNRAALNAPVDILAHPGLITEPEAKLAAKKGIFLEISARKGAQPHERPCCKGLSHVQHGIGIEYGQPRSRGSGERGNSMEDRFGSRHDGERDQSHVQKLEDPS